MSVKNYVSSLDIVGYGYLDEFRFSEKEHRIANKLLPKIIESDIFDEFRDPKEIQANFQYHLESWRCHHLGLQSASLNVRDWNGDLFYQEHFMVSGPNEYTAVQWTHITPYPSLFSHSIEGFNIKNRETLVVERFEAKFYDETLPKFMETYYGFMPGTKIYRLIENKIKDDIKVSIYHNMRNRKTQNRSGYNCNDEQGWPALRPVHNIYYSR